MKYGRFIPVIVWCGLIFYLSAQPYLKVSQDTWTDLLLRKAAHIGEYAILFLLTYRALHTLPKQRRTLYSALFAIGYAMSDEWHQSFVPGRGPSIRDVGVDSIGVFLAVVWVRMKQRLWK